MKSHTYLEAILTINALLLGGLVWMSAAGPSPTMPAIAVGQDNQPMAFPNPDLQREELLRAIRSMSDDVRTMRNDFKTTEFKVRVVSMPKNGAGGAQAPQGKQHSETAVSSEPMIQVTRVTKPIEEDK